MPTIDVLVRLPGAKTPESISLNSDLSISETVAYIAQELGVDNLKQANLVIAPSKTKPGSILPTNTQLRSINFHPKEDILELWHAPSIMNVAIFFRDSGQNILRLRKEIPIDFGSRVLFVVPTLQRALELGDQEFSIQFTDSDEGESLMTPRWLNCQSSLRDQGVNPGKGWILCYPLVKLFKTPEQTLIPLAKGWLFKRSIKKEHTTNKQKRLFILSEVLLFYYKKERDSAPAGIIPLDYYYITERIQKKKKKYAMMLTSSYDQFKMTHQYKLQAETPEAWEEWFEKIKSKCLNSGNQRIFGINLIDVVARKSNQSKWLPNIIRDCINYLDENALDQEGLFRLSAPASTIEYYKDQYDLGELVQFSALSDHNIPAALMKLYFRELPEPLFTCEIYNKILSVDSISDQTARIKAFSEIIAELPLEHYGTAKTLFAFLSRVASRKEQNKMGAANLATVFAPNLMRGTDESSNVAHFASINSLTEFLINHHEEIFTGAEEINQSLRVCTITPVTNRATGWSSGKKTGQRMSRGGLSAAPEAPGLSKVRGLSGTQSDSALGRKGIPLPNRGGPANRGNPMRPPRKSDQLSPPPLSTQSPPVPTQPPPVPTQPPPIPTQPPPMSAQQGQKRPITPNRNANPRNQPRPHQEQSSRPPDQLKLSSDQPRSSEQQSRLPSRPSLTDSDSSSEPTTFEELLEILQKERAAREKLEQEVHQLANRIAALENAKQ